MSLYEYAEIRETDSLLDKIIYQGEKLRKSLIRSIVNNDPFISADLLTSRTSTERTAHLEPPGKL